MILAAGKVDTSKNLVQLANEDQGTILTEKLVNSGSKVRVLDHDAKNVRNLLSGHSVCPNIS